MFRLKVLLICLVLCLCIDKYTGFDADNDDDDLPVWGEVKIERTTEVPFSSRLGDNSKNKGVDDKILEIFNNCSCVRYYLCDDNNCIITDGKTLFNPRMREDEDKLKCSNPEFVCCKLCSDNSHATSPTSITIPNLDESTTENNPTPSPEEPGNRNKEPKFVCGRQKPVFNSRIKTTDKDNSFVLSGEFPWIAAIFQKARSSAKYKHKCGGSLIHPQFILTATHCVKSATASNLKVYLSGDAELKNIGENPENEREVEKIIVHPHYNSGSLFNDVALLKLMYPYEVAGQINTICLPKPSLHYNKEKCLAAGWMQNHDSKVLKKVELPLIDNGKCEQLLRKTRLGEFFDLDDSFLCAGGEKGKDTCEGDGGNPLVCPTNRGRYVQVGIVSWGVECGDENVPGVYANVPVLHQWIEEQIKNNIN